jgi:hypothetical protein
MTIPTLACPVVTTIASVPVATMARTWEAMRSRRRSNRSASDPPVRDSSITGTNTAACVTPTMKDRWVSLKTRTPCATDCRNVPEFEMSWPVKNSRKFRSRSRLPRGFCASGASGAASDATVSGASIRPGAY